MSWPEGKHQRKACWSRDGETRLAYEKCMQRKVQYTTYMMHWITGTMKPQLGVKWDLRYGLHHSLMSQKWSWCVMAHCCVWQLYLRSANAHSFYKLSCFCLLVSCTSANLSWLYWKNKVSLDWINVVIFFLNQKHANVSLFIMKNPADSVNQWWLWGHKILPRVVQRALDHWLLLLFFKCVSAYTVKNKCLLPDQN